MSSRRVPPLRSPCISQCVSWCASLCVFRMCLQYVSRAGYTLLSPFVRTRSVRASSFDFLDNSRPSPYSLVVLCVTFSGPVLHSFSSVINAFTRTFYVRFSCVLSILNVIHRLTLFSNEVRLFEVRPSALFRLCKEEVADIQ